MPSILSAKHFHDEEAAFTFVESRLWPDGPICPHCGGFERIGRLKGKSTRMGVHKCYQCRKPFTVKVGTVFESSKLPMHIWLQAMFLMCSSKKGISTTELHRILGLSLKTAWFLSHRIREAMTSLDLTPLGANGGIVEVDETYIGFEPGAPVKRAFHHKMKVVTMLDRTTKTKRSVVMDEVRSETMTALLHAHMSRDAVLMTDESSIYTSVGKTFAAHKKVDHGRRSYVDPNDSTIHTETVEGTFSTFKRGMRGIYQHCAKPHLHRYCTEFDFRYNYRQGNGYNDGYRTDALICGTAGKRLTYKALTEASCRNQTPPNPNASSKRRRTRWKTKESRFAMRVRASNSSSEA